MNDAGIHFNREQFFTNTHRVVATPRDGWWSIVFDFKISSEIADWDKISIDASDSSDTNTEWIEIMDDENKEKFPPEWYRRLMAGSGSLDALFGGGLCE